MVEESVYFYSIFHQRTSEFHKCLITETIKLGEILGPEGVQAAPLCFNIKQGWVVFKVAKQKQICHMQVITCCTISFSSSILFFSFLYISSQVATSNHLNKMGCYKSPFRTTIRFEEGTFGSSLTSS